MGKSEHYCQQRIRRQESEISDIDSRPARERVLAVFYTAASESDVQIVGLALRRVHRLGSARDGETLNASSHATMEWEEVLGLDFLRHVAVIGG
jgi:hypothetical protein